jgi:prevent-host-death family protein
MAAASVSDLKDHLNVYLDQVKAGEEVVVTEDGHAIARLVPFTRSGPTPAEYEEMVRSGQIRPAKNPLKPGDPIPWPTVPDPEGFALKALLQEREEGL